MVRERHLPDDGAIGAHANNRVGPRSATQPRGDPHWARGPVAGDAQRKEHPPDLDDGELLTLRHEPAREQRVARHEPVDERSNQGSSHDHAGAPEVSKTSPDRRGSVTQMEVATATPAGTTPASWPRAGRWPLRGKDVSSRRPRPRPSSTPHAGGGIVRAPRSEDRIRLRDVHGTQGADGDRRPLPQDRAVGVETAQ